MINELMAGISKRRKIASSGTFDVGPYRYFRVSVSGNSVGVLIRDLRFYEYVSAGSCNIHPDNMTSNSSPSPYVASTTSGSAAAYVSFNSDYIIDGMSITTGQWLKLDCGSAKTIQAFKLRYTYTVATSNSFTFTLEGSNDDSLWTTLSSYTLLATGTSNTAFNCCFLPAKNLTGSVFKLVIPWSGIQGTSNDLVDPIASTGTKNIAALATAAGWNGTDKVQAGFVGNCTGTVALDANGGNGFESGTLPSGSIIAACFESTGSCGAFGGGGSGGSHASVNGKNGGTAVVTTANTLIYNAAIISAGGGGGGAARSGLIGSTQRGGGGASFGTRGNGGSTTGNNGTLTTGGAGAPGAGSGGDLNQNGTSATSGTVSNGTGGTKGSCVVGDSNITWLNYGTRTGTIS